MSVQRIRLKVAPPEAARLISPSQLDALGGINVRYSSAQLTEWDVLRQCLYDIHGTLGRLPTAGEFRNKDNRMTRLEKAFRIHGNLQEVRSRFYQAHFWDFHPPRLVLSAALGCGRLSKPENADKLAKRFREYYGYVPSLRQLEEKDELAKVAAALKRCPEPWDQLSISWYVPPELRGDAEQIRAILSGRKFMRGNQLAAEEVEAAAIEIVKAVGEFPSVQALRKLGLNYFSDSVVRYGVNKLRRALNTPTLRTGAVSLKHPGVFIPVAVGFWKAHGTLSHQAMLEAGESSLSRAINAFHGGRKKVLAALWKQMGSEDKVAVAGAALARSFGRIGMTPDEAGHIYGFFGLSPRHGPTSESPAAPAGFDSGSVRNKLEILKKNSRTSNHSHLRDILLASKGEAGAANQLGRLLGFVEAIVSRKSAGSVNSDPLLYAFICKHGGDLIKFWKAHGTLSEAEMKKHPDLISAMHGSPVNRETLLPELWKITSSKDRTAITDAALKKAFNTVKFSQRELGILRERHGAAKVLQQESSEDDAGVLDIRGKFEKMKMTPYLQDLGLTRQVQPERNNGELSGDDVLDDLGHDARFFGLYKEFVRMTYAANKG